MAKLLLHFHRPGARVVTHDLSPPSLADQYRDLGERLSVALAAQGHSTDGSLKVAAGVAIYDLSGAVLLMKRRSDCDDHPGEWSFPAGRIEPGETPEQCARREVWEETGRRPIVLRPIGIYEEPGVCFHGFKELVVTAFTPRLDWEHTAFMWSTPDNRPRPLHPGVTKILRLAKGETKDDATSTDPEGKWVTLHGAHVFINKKGEITKGPAHLLGKDPYDITQGAEPKLEPKNKGVKNIVHELLSTGHEWHFDQLKEATGSKLDQQLHNALNELKAGKGKLGQLAIQKTGPKQYQVVKPDGTPAPGLPKADPQNDGPAADDPFWQEAKMKQEEADLEAGLIGPGPLDEPEATPTPTPEPVVAPEPVPEAPSAPSVEPPTGKAPATPMSKAQADEVYAGHLKSLNADIAGNVEAHYGDPDFDPATDLQFLEGQAKNWKDGKALAMAQWAANVKGGDHAPKPQQVFPADIELVKELAASASDKQPNKAAAQAKAIADWKAATAKAKLSAASLKTTPPTPAQEDTYLADVPPSPKKPAEAAVQPAPVDVSGITHSLEAPKTIVPDDHRHITADDFANGEYSANIDKFHELLHAGEGDSVHNKINIEKNLGARLVASPSFKDIEAQYDAGPGQTASMYAKTLAARLISQWASSSGNHHPVSVAAQLSIRDAFNMDPEHVETKAFHYLESVGGDEAKVYKMAAGELGVKVDTPQQEATFKAALRDFALAQYHSTQDHLASLGIKEVFLTRGMKFGDSKATPTQVNLKMQPASSFTTKHSIGRQFAGGHSMFTVRVPASQILSSFMTGYGCTSESEVVVLSHPGMQAIQIGSAHAGTQASMSNAVAKGLGGVKKLKGPAKTLNNKTDVFKPTNLPVKPPTASKKYSSEAIKLAKIGDIKGLQEMHESLSSGSMPNTKAYVKQVLTSVENQHKAFTEQQQIAKAHAQAPALHGDSPTGETKKNAYYYKKLKEKVLGHPQHSEVGYDALKKSGLTNEQILAAYKQVYENQLGKEPS